MSFQYDISGQEPSLSQEEESQFWAEQLAKYLKPYQERLDAYLDRRVVGNLMATVGAIVQSRCEANWAVPSAEPPTPRPAPNGCSTLCTTQAGRPR